jgi:coenzyme F420-0:L-glutamate ligase/coenzyme F420-1:gamma-L-glutamate ligase
VTDARGASRHRPLEVWAVVWPEIGPGDDLTGLVCAIEGLRDGDIVIVTSKVVSKAEGRRVMGDRTGSIAAETRRVVARRGLTVIAETHHGLVLAAAGVDASNTPAGTALLLPVDPDATARRLRHGVHDANGINIAVVVSDTAGRAWRLGQTDIAIGCAGLQPLVDLQGSRDTHGNQLLVTAPAIADELAAASELVKQKATGRPVAVARGLGDLVLPPGEDGPGAVAVVRDRAEDLFGLAAREAVVAAVHRTDRAALDHFPRRVAQDADPFDGLVEAWLRSLSAEQRDQVRPSLTRGAETPAHPCWALSIAVRGDAEAAVLVAAGRLLERAEALGASQRLATHEDPRGEAPPGWRLVAARCWQDR